jgi:hypothetical protein
MTPEEFLQQLNPHSRVFDLSIDYKYTEEQLVLFAKLYHESELKKLRVTDVSNRRELLIAFMESLTTEDLTQIEIAEFDNVANKFLGN